MVGPKARSSRDSGVCVTHQPHNPSQTTSLHTRRGGRPQSRLLRRAEAEPSGLERRLSGGGASGTPARGREGAWPALHTLLRCCQRACAQQPRLGTRTDLFLGPTPSPCTKEAFFLELKKLDSGKLRKINTCRRVVIMFQAREFYLLPVKD